MRDYLYDGTFEGILTCIYHHYYTDKAAGIYPRSEYQPNMLNGYTEIRTDPEKAVRVYGAIANKISGYALRMIYRAYLSSVPGKENVILNYVLLGFRTGPSIGSLHALDAVKAMEDITRKVGNEKERMLQFVRFEVMENTDPDAGKEILYAEIEPDHDVLELIAYHFADRFRHDPLIIRDIGRDKAIAAYEGSWYIMERESLQLLTGGELTRTEGEVSYQRLWQTYFNHIAIKERINPRCQKNHMPVRYWKHLTEMMR